MTGSKRITIFQMNDTHGYLDLHQELFWSGSGEEYKKAGGYARIASIMNEARRDNAGRVLAFDCGDTIHGTHPAVESKGEALVPILNALGFDAMTAHWEFAYGPAHFRELVKSLDYPMLAINCYEKESGNLVFDPYVVRECGGLRVGIIGIAATIVDKVMPPSYSEGVRFSLGNEELPGYIAKLRAEEKVDLVVVISHLGFPQEVKLSQEVPGIDVLLSGHTHNRLYKPVVVNGTIIIQSGCHGSFLGRLDLEVDNRRISGCEHRLITVSEKIAPDPDVQSLVEEALVPYREERSHVVGETAVGLNRNTILESTMDNLLLESMVDLMGAQLAFSNGWRYGAPVPPGPVTLDDLYNVIPMNPPVMTIKLTGDEIRTMLEENIERTFSRDPYQQMGGYLKRCIGLKLYIKIENPEGERIQELFIGGEPVRPDKVYSAAFVTQQGVPEKYGSNRQSTGMQAVEAMQCYFAHKKRVGTGLRGSVIAV